MLSTVYTIQKEEEIIIIIIYIYRYIMLNRTEIHN